MLRNLKTKLIQLRNKYFDYAITSSTYLEAVGYRGDGAVIYQEKHKKHWYLKCLHKGK